MLDDEETAIAELEAFRDAGGGTIVDVTTRGIGRNPGALARASRASGVNVVMATGYLVAASHPPDVRDRDEAALAAEMIHELGAGSRTMPTVRRYRRESSRSGVAIRSIRRR